MSSTANSTSEPLSEIKRSVVLPADGIDALARLAFELL